MHKVIHYFAGLSLSHIVLFKIMRLLFSLTFILLTLSTARAETFLDDNLISRTSHSSWDTFIIPNELHPELASPLLKATSPGVYIAVGAERGFIGSSLSQATHLVLTDKDESVVLYNKINRLLLELALDLNDYLWLRKSATSSEWKNSAHSRSLSLRNSMELTEYNWKFWRQWESQARVAYSDAPSDLLYFNNEHLFSKLQTMAKNDRIKIYLMDLGDSDDVHKLILGLKQAEIPLSVLDISNAWWPRYMSSEEVNQLVSSFKGVSNKSSLFMLTKLGGTKHWKYQTSKILEINNINYWELPWLGHTLHISKRRNPLESCKLIFNTLLKLDR